MKRFVFLLCAVFVLTFSIVPAFAAVDDPEAVPDSEPEVLEDFSGEDIPAEDEPVAADPDLEPDAELVESPEDDMELNVVDDTSFEESGVSVAVDSSAVVVRDVADRTDMERTSLVDAIYSLFGEYTPRTYTVTTYLDDGTAIQSTEIVPGLAGLDYDWIAGVSVFVLALYCIFRMIGGMFRWK